MSNSKVICITIAIIIMAIIGIAYCMIQDGTIQVSNNIFIKSIRKETISKENYEELSTKIPEELGETDDAYYFSYSSMYYVMKEGFTQEYLTTEDQSLLYKNIYGKTVQNLIDEGKQLMKDNNITLEQFKEQLLKMKDYTTNNN